LFSTHSCRPLTRTLYAWEIQEARRVFGESLAYERVRIHECARWPATLDRIGRRLKGMPPPERPNAVTLGNHCYFPVRLPQAPPEPETDEFYHLLWLIHELTHVWQFQQYGWRYLFRSLSAQFGLGAAVYDFGGEEGLLQAILDGLCLRDFNPEQQGDICRDYYHRLRLDKTLRAWQPFIGELQSFQNAFVKNLDENSSFDDNALADALDEDADPAQTI
jgi:hypothetical protein